MSSLSVLHSMDADTFFEPTLEKHEVADLRRLHEAALEALDCQRVLKKVGLNLVGELLKGQEGFFEFTHYPEGDVYDAETGSQYYYHAHREANEHGHFHVFHRPDEDNCPGKVQAPTHIIAISMDAWGEPIGLFTTNRWVTDETWRSAAETLVLAGAFKLDHAWPSWPVNRWLSAMIATFRPHLELLLHQRDREIQRYAARHSGNVLEDRGLEVISQAPISLVRWERHLAEHLV